MRGFLNHTHYTFIGKVLFQAYLTKYQRADNKDKEKKDETLGDPWPHKSNSGPDKESYNKTAAVTISYLTFNKKKRLAGQACWVKVVRLYSVTPHP